MNIHTWIWLWFTEDTAKGCGLQPCSPNPGHSGGWGPVLHSVISPDVLGEDFASLILLLGAKLIMSLPSRKLTNGKSSDQSLMDGRIGKDRSGREGLGDLVVNDCFLLLGWIISRSVGCCIPFGYACFWAYFPHSWILSVSSRTELTGSLLQRRTALTPPQSFHVLR